MHDVFQGQDEQWYFRVKAANGQIVAQSEGYVSESNAKRGYHVLLDAVHADVLYHLRHGTIVESEASMNSAMDIYIAQLGRDADLDIAIGEHAFIAGFKAGAERADSEQHTDDQILALANESWSDYDPPEELKGGGTATPVDKAIANVHIAEQAVIADGRRGRAPRG